MSEDQQRLLAPTESAVLDCYQGVPHSHKSRYEQKYVDVPYSVFFVLSTIGLLIAAIVVLCKHIPDLKLRLFHSMDSQIPDANFLSLKFTLIALFAASVCGFLIVLLLFLLVWNISKKLLTWSTILWVLSSLVSVCLFSFVFVFHRSDPVIIALSMSVCSLTSSLLWLFMFYKRIRLNDMLLTLSVKVLRSHFSIVLPVTFALALIQWLWFLGFAFSVYIFSQFLNDGAWPMCIWASINCFWGTQIWSNVLHTAVYGLVGRAYTVTDDETYHLSAADVNQLLEENNHDNDFHYFSLSRKEKKNLITLSLKNSLTYSFGAVCHGSIFMFFSKTVLSLIRYMYSGDSLACCSKLGDLLNAGFSFMKTTVSLFNNFSFVIVAVYGEGFKRAGRRAVLHLQNANLWFFVNDTIIQWFTRNISFFAGFLNGTIVLFLLHVLNYLKKDFFFNSIPHEKSPFMALSAESICAFFIGFFLAALLTEIVMSLFASYLVTFFMVFADHPSKIARRHPDLVKLITEEVERNALEDEPAKLHRTSLF